MVSLESLANLQIFCLANESKKASGACTIKLLTDFRNKLVFVSGKPFQPSLIFVGEARGIQKPAKKLFTTNTLAYMSGVFVTEKESFMTLTPGRRRVCRREETS